MKSLKDFFENYRVPVDETGWNAIANNPAVKKHNRSRHLQKAALYGTATLAAAAAIITAVVLTRPQTDEPTQTTPSPEIVQKTVIQSENTPAVAISTPSASKAPVTVSYTSPEIAQPITERALVANTPVLKSESAEIPVPMPADIPTLSPTLPATVTPPETSFIPESDPKSIPTPENTAVRSEPDTIHPQQPQIADKRFFAPNAFSPNGDGINDIFYVYANTEYTDFELNIYSRNGDHVFQSRSIENGWNGRRKGTGDILPQGVYVYTIKYKTTDRKSGVEKGQIMLIQ